MYLNNIICLATCLSFALPALAGPALQKRVTWGPVADATIKVADPSASAPGVWYGRSEIIGDTLYATERSTYSEPPVFPIHKSTDGGKTWTHISDVKDTVNGWGLRYQPHLYILKNDMGGYAAGTMLLAGNSVPEDLHATYIDLYASTDKGVTWKFVSNIAIGGEAVSQNGHDPIWEPFLMEYDGRLICYYSDQRDPAHGQKLVHQSTTDLRNWDDVKTDVANPKYSERPGMPTVALMPNGKYILFYENVGRESSNGGVPVYYRISSDPFNFNDADEHRLIAANGYAPNGGSPYVTWTSAGGPNGMVIANSADTGYLYTNTNLGDPGSWKQFATGGTAPAYSRSLRILPDPTYVLIVGAGKSHSQTNGRVRADVVKLT
ncbi:hypothetical protein FQN50_001081 [Emmonsiellopsis sp. PD_5]|nr:hypothetical protein FQN50_001081 [Emmonsiellopsis sp. PD_5]